MHMKICSWTDEINWVDMKLTVRLRFEEIMNFFFKIQSNEFEISFCGLFGWIGMSQSKSWFWTNISGSKFLDKNFWISIFKSKFLDQNPWVKISESKFLNQSFWIKKFELKFVDQNFWIKIFGSKFLTQNFLLKIS